MEAVHLQQDDWLVLDHEIRSTLPSSVFDAHCHLLGRKFHPRIDETLPHLPALRSDIGVDELNQWWSALLPGIRMSGLLMGTPTTDLDAAGENKWVADAAQNDGLPFALLVPADVDTDQLEREIASLRPAAICPYLPDAALEEGNTLASLLGETILAAADRHRIAIYVSALKPNGLADPEHTETFARAVSAYPQVNYVLTNCGGCRITPHMQIALSALPREPNVWIETSEVCDMGVFQTLFSGFDVKKILFGSGLVSRTGHKGSVVRMGRSWHHVDGAILDGKSNNPIRETFAIYENLCALCHAMRFSGLSEKNCRKIFHDNAQDLFA